MAQWAKPVWLHALDRTNSKVSINQLYQTPTVVRLNMMGRRFSWTSGIRPVRNSLCQLLPLIFLLSHYSFYVVLIIPSTPSESCGCAGARARAQPASQPGRKKAALFENPICAPGSVKALTGYPATIPRVSQGYPTKLGPTQTKQIKNNKNKYKKIKKTINVQ